MIDAELKMADNHDPENIWRLVIPYYVPSIFRKNQEQIPPYVYLAIEQAELKFKNKVFQRKSKEY